MQNKISQSKEKAKFQRTLNGIEKGLYKRFKKNTLQMRGEIRWGSVLEFIQSDYEPREIIISGFLFRESTEGLEYWVNIYRQLEAL